MDNFITQHEFSVTTSYVSLSYISFKCIKIYLCTFFLVMLNITEHRYMNIQIYESVSIYKAEVTERHLVLRL